MSPSGRGHIKNKTSIYIGAEFMPERDEIKENEQLISFQRVNDSRGSFINYNTLLSVDKSDLKS